MDCEVDSEVAKTRSRATVATRRVHVHALASSSETRAVDGPSSSGIVRPKPRLCRGAISLGVPVPAPIPSPAESSRRFPFCSDPQQSRLLSPRASPRLIGTPRRTRSRCPFRRDAHRSHRRAPRDRVPRNATGSGRIGKEVRFPNRRRDRACGEGVDAPANARPPGKTRRLARCLAKASGAVRRPIPRALTRARCVCPIVKIGSKGTGDAPSDRTTRRRYSARASSRVTAPGSAIARRPSPRRLSALRTRASRRWRA